MAQLTANAIQIYEDGFTNSIPVKASTEIFLGSAVGTASGLARQLVAADLFVGFAEQHVNNTGADSALSVPVRKRGSIVLAIASAAVGDIGKPVYASDGNTFTYTSTGNSRVGTVARFVSTGIVVVAFGISDTNGAFV